MSVQMERVVQRSAVRCFSKRFCVIIFSECLTRIMHQRGNIGDERICPIVYRQPTPESVIYLYYFCFVVTRIVIIPFANRL